MANIRVDLDYTIKDGSSVVFRSPCDCTEITGLIVYYIGADGNQTSKEFLLADAHGENVGDIPHLFASDVVVKVILDVTSGMAFVQNADTNAYIERTFVKTVNGKSPDENGNVTVSGGGGGSGEPGEDGFSPIATVEQTDSGAVISITDKNGTTTATVTNGKDGYTPVKDKDYFDGKDGDPGTDGTSPTVAVSKSGKVTTVSITDKDGTKTATINDGADGYTPVKGKDYFDGQPGAPGTSVTVAKVTESTADGGSNVVEFSDGKTLTIKNGNKGSKGDKGDSPVKGVDYFTEADKAEMMGEIGIEGITNPIDASDPIWTQWNGRLAFGMQPSTAPVPFKVNGQMLVDGTLMTHNSGTQDKNRWGFHVFEAYAKNNWARLTMLLDKHTAEAGDKPSTEIYYYIDRHHNAASYGNTKIGSDVAYHSFCFDRDRMTAYGEIDAKMPITLARISLANDLDTTHKKVEDADAAYEAENYPEENNRCLKYIALLNAEDGAMFYDVDRDRPVMKVGGIWCDIPFTVISDPAYDIFNTTVVYDVAWEMGVIGGTGALSDKTNRIRTVDYIPAGVKLITPAPGYEFCICCYNEWDVYHPDGIYYNATSKSFGGPAAYSAEPLDITAVNFVKGEYTYNKLRVIARRTDGADMTANEGANIVMT